MTIRQHLAFLALLVPTVLLLIAATISLANLGADAPPVDAPRHETAY